jgi:hypothetical protein
MGDAPADMRERFLGVRERQQVVHVTTFDRTPGQMLRNQSWIEAFHEGLQLLQVIGVQRVGRTQRKPDAVKAQWITGAELL